MDPLPTLDLLLSDESADHRRLAGATAAAVAAALADRAAIEAFDRAAPATDWEHGPRSVAVAVHDQYRAWATAAAALRQRVAATAARAGPVAGADRLDDAIGRTAARLAVPVEELAASIRDHREGRVLQFASVEEMRRELLQTGVQRSGSGPLSPTQSL